MVNKSNYREAKDLINNICAIEDCITHLDRDSEAKSSIIEIRIDSTDGKNGWPSKYSIPINKKDDFFNCLKQVYQKYADEKYQELNNLK